MQSKLDETEKFMATLAVANFNCGFENDFWQFSLIFTEQAWWDGEVGGQPGPGVGPAGGEEAAEEAPGAGEGPGDEVVWLARDVRETDKGEQGPGLQEKPSGARPKKRYSCATCHDNCCGLARELVATAFKLGKVTMSPKVLIVVISI